MHPRPLRDRFEEKFIRRGPDECWEWTAYKSPKGYGKIGRGGRGAGMMQAHRASWELYRGPIPIGMHVLHKCDNPSCVNPNHLFLGDDAANQADKMAKGRYRNGKKYYGEGHHNQTIPEDVVRKIKAMAGTMPVTHIAKICGVSFSHTHRIIHGESRTKVWKDEGEPPCD